MPTCQDFIRIASAAYNPVSKSAQEATHHSDGYYKSESWVCQTWKEGSLSNSFQGGVWQQTHGQGCSRGGDLIIGFCGTNPWQKGKLISDLVADAKLAINVLPNQCTPAYQLAQLAREMAEGRGCNLFLTGHSLGGFLAQIVGFWLGIPFVTFNAPPASKALAFARHNLLKPHMRQRTRHPELDLHDSPNINFSVNQDPVSRLMIGKHVGRFIKITSTLPGLMKHDPKFCWDALQNSGLMRSDPFEVQDASIPERTSPSGSARRSNAMRRGRR